MIAVVESMIAACRWATVVAVAQQAPLVIPTMRRTTLLVEQEPRMLGNINGDDQTQTAPDQVQLEQRLLAEALHNPELPRRTRVQVSFTNTPSVNGVVKNSYHHAPSPHLRPLLLPMKGKKKRTEAQV